MLLCLFLLFLLCESTETQPTQYATTWGYYYSTPTAVTTTKVQLTPAHQLTLQLVATPDYPVAAGQTVNLQCTADTIPDSIEWSWERLENQTWQLQGTGQDLTLTKPEQSGIYRCYAMRGFFLLNMSSTHTVYIVAKHTTVAEKLGIAAFVLSLLSLIIILAVLIWLGCKRPGSTMTTSNTAAKGFPGPEKSPKGGFPQTECDGDVYMNYTSTSGAYTDLDLNNVTVDNVYSSLS